MAKQRDKKREGKKEMSDSETETRVGKPWTSRIERERFRAFSSNCPGRNSNATEKAKKGREPREGERRKQERKRPTINAVQRTQSATAAKQNKMKCKCTDRNQMEMESTTVNAVPAFGAHTK
jgi:hypothetical protein